MGDVAAALTWPLTRPPLRPGERMYVPSTRIRRCLFGIVDHERAQEILQDGIADAYEKDKQRWNFDFENDRPLPGGRYTWQRVGGDPSDTDSNGGSETQDEKKDQPARLHQTQITDFMRKRKSSNQDDDSPTHRPKIRRRSST